MAKKDSTESFSNELAKNELQSFDYDHSLIEKGLALKITSP